MAKAWRSLPSRDSAIKARLYSRAYCHLCHEMAQALRGLGFDFEEVDVDADPELDQRFGADVPVLVDARGAEICRHRLSAEAIGRLALE